MRLHHLTTLCRNVSGFQQRDLHTLLTYALDMLLNC